MAKHAASYFIDRILAYNPRITDRARLPSLRRYLFSKPTEPRWLDDHNFVMDDVAFLATIKPTEYHSITSTDSSFLLIKTKDMIDNVLDLSRRASINSVLDIGIWQGGSVVFYDLLFRPAKLVAIEYHKRPIAALANYIAKRDRAENVHLHYGVNQGDAERMNAILATEFGGGRVDLIVDDASHQYVETRTAFNAAFPYLAPGGYYVIEDWGWAHGSRGIWKIPYFDGKLALTNLVVELCILAACRPDLIARIEITRNSAMIVKGDGEVPCGEFDIGALSKTRGQPFMPSL